MAHYQKPDNASAVAAKFEALKIVFAPVVFQVSYALLKLGILQCIGDYGEEGVSAEKVSRKLDLSLYGVKVLLDVGLSGKLVWLNGDNYVLDKTGYFILSDTMVQTNFDFIQDVCYQGLQELITAVKTGKPEGLKVFGDWQTIYPALSSLPEPAKTSWFKFDHYYSDRAFPKILPKVFARPIRRLFDIGGNTGKWAFKCVEYDPEVKVTIIDLPEQCAVVNESIAQKKLSSRIDAFPIDLLDHSAQLPKGADAIWMSQFLDCFSEVEIVSILQRVVAAMDSNSKLYILELFWDRQFYEAAAFSLNCISIYFTCMANGTSRMYHSRDFLKLVTESGLKIESETDNIGLGHTLLVCRKG